MYQEMSYTNTFVLTVGPTASLTLTRSLPAARNNKARHIGLTTPDHKYLD